MTEKLTDEEKIGQLLFLGITAQKDISAAKTLVQQFHPGGFLLFSQNDNTPSMIYDITSTLQKDSPVPLFFAVDQEGGIVQRLSERHGFTDVPSLMAISATQNTQNAYTAGKILAQELSAAGVNVDFAPVLDVNTKIENPIINIRSFGQYAKTVTTFASEMVKGFHDGGVLTCGKHFPGHGDTIVDSHKGLSTVNLPLKTLEDVHIRPFADAIKNKQLDFIMTAHVLYTALDKANPATLSKKILTDYLRNKLKYDGIVITDALEMQALSGKKSTEEVCRDSLLAGADMLLVADANPEKLVKIKSFLLEQMQKDKALQEKINASVTRILQTKQKAALLQTQSAFNADNFRTEENIMASLRIAKESLTLIKNETKIPLPLAPELKVLMVSPKNVFKDPATGWERHLSSSIGLYLKEHQPFVAEFFYSEAPSKKELEKLAQLAGKSDVIIFASFSLSFSKEQKELAEKILSFKKPSVAVALTTPYDAKFLKKFPAVILTYGYRSIQLAAAAESFLSGFEWKGNLPVHIQ